jgi:hypothetical protein
MWSTTCGFQKEVWFYELPHIVLPRFCPIPSWSAANLHPDELLSVSEVGVHRLRTGVFAYIRTAVSFKMHISTGTKTGDKGLCLDFPVTHSSLLSV